MAAKLDEPSRRDVLGAALSGLAAFTLPKALFAQVSGPQGASALANAEENGPASRPAALTLAATDSAVMQLRYQANRHHLPAEVYSEKNRSMVEEIIGRWNAYAGEMKAASASSDPFVELSKAQGSFIDWLKEKARAAGISGISLQPPVNQTLADLPEQVSVFCHTLPSLLAKNGIILPNDQGCQTMLTEKGGQQRALLFALPPTQIFAVVSKNDPAIMQRLSHVDPASTPLIAITRKGGAAYQRSPIGNIVGAGSFSQYGTGFLNIDIVQDTTEFLRKQKDGYIRNLIPLRGLDVPEVMRAVGAGPVLAPEGQSAAERLKDGGIVIDRLIAYLGTDGFKQEFSWERVRFGLAMELASHELEHAHDNQKGNEVKTNLEKVRMGATKAPLQDRIEAETLIEMQVRLESMRYSPQYYLLRLIGEARAGFDFGGAALSPVSDQGFLNAQKGIYEAMLAELSERPEQYGLKIVTPALVEGDMKLAPREQLLAQLDHFSYDPELVSRMISAITKRAKISERAAALEEKYR